MKNTNKGRMKNNQPELPNRDMNPIATPFRQLSKILLLAEVLLNRVFCGRKNFSKWF